MASTVGGQSEREQWAILPATTLGSLLRDTWKTKTRLSKYTCWVLQVCGVIQSIKSHKMHQQTHLDELLRGEVLWSPEEQSNVRKSQGGPRALE